MSDSGFGVEHDRDSGKHFVPTTLEQAQHSFRIVSVLGLGQNLFIDDNCCVRRQHRPVGLHAGSGSSFLCRQPFDIRARVFAGAQRLVNFHRAELKIPAHDAQDFSSTRAGRGEQKLRQLNAGGPASIERLI